MYLLLLGLLACTRSDEVVEHPGSVEIVNEITGTTELRPVAEFDASATWGELDGQRVPIVKAVMRWHHDRLCVDYFGPDGRWLRTSTSAQVPLSKLVLDPKTHPTQLEGYSDAQIFTATLEALAERGDSTRCGDPSTRDAGRCVFIADERAERSAWLAVSELPDGVAWRDPPGTPDPVAQCTIRRTKWVDEAVCEGSDGTPLRRELTVHTRPPRAPTMRDEHVEPILVVDEITDREWQDEGLARFRVFSRVVVGREEVPVGKIVQRGGHPDFVRDLYTEDGVFLKSETKSTVLRPDSSDLRPVQWTPKDSGAR
ncbi:MAG: hypothetical protein H6740_08200 [Alphaproteobacteria bacterium]|nr:hypothetical protein [Alphaproteobacteria bacterium]